MNMNYIPIYNTVKPFFDNIKDCEYISFHIHPTGDEKSWRVYEETLGINGKFYWEYLKSEFLPIYDDLYEVLMNIPNDEKFNTIRNKLRTMVSDIWNNKICDKSIHELKNQVFSYQNTLLIVDVLNAAGLSHSINYYIVMVYKDSRVLYASY